MAANIYHRHHHLRQTKKSKKQSAIDRWVYFAVIFGPIMTLPQVYDIWALGKREISVITWSAYVVIATIWLFYGLKHKARPIIIVQAIWIVLDLAVIVGVLR